jgi:outer membrane biosynthesis protein TonB
VKLPKMKTGLVISVLGHFILLVWGLMSFTLRPLAAPPVEIVQADMISASDFSQMTKGVKDAPLKEKPAPLVEKIGDPKLVSDLRKVEEKKPEIQTAATEPPPPPKPEAKPVEAKPEEKFAPPEKPKVDAIAEALKKEEARKAAEAKRKAAEEKKRAEAKKKAEQQKPQPRFDPTQIAALLDKRAPRRTAAAGDALNSEPSLGYANGNAAQLSQSELDALRARLQQCWSPPVGAAAVANLKVVLRVLFRPDGSIAAPPELVAGTNSSFGPALAESAKRALLTCQPFNMLKREHYEQWKDIEITFDPRDMFRG